MPAATGPCNEYLTRYFFNTKTKNCDAFVYGGCGGNENMFLTRKECIQQCISSKNISNEVDTKQIQTSNDIGSPDENNGNSVEQIFVVDEGEFKNRIEMIVRKMEKPDDVVTVATTPSIKDTPAKHSTIKTKEKSSKYVAIKRGHACK